MNQSGRLSHTRLDTLMYLDVYGSTAQSWTQRPAGLQQQQPATHNIWEALIRRAAGVAWYYYCRPRRQPNTPAGLAT